MPDAVVGLLVLAAVGAVLVVLAIVATRVRRSGSAGPAIGAAMAAYDEAMHSTAYTSFVEVQAQDERKVPLIAADDL